MRYLVGLSGGADSAAVALSLRDAGHEVVGVLLRFFPDSDASAAEFVAEKLGIEFHVLSAEEAFSETVIRDFLTEYARGRTPNPCALCNREMKLALLCKAADTYACDRVATGHYAAVCEEDGRYFVRAGADKSRDQSYFLWRVTQEELSRTDFVLAEEKKAALLPRLAQFLPEGVKESREVCFIPGDDRVGFLEGLLPEEAKLPGDFVDDQGSVLARHDGIFRYTVGQRRGFGVGFGRRVYVREIDAASRAVVLADKQSCEGVGCTLSTLNFQKMRPANGQFPVFCRVRYRAPLLPAVLTVEGASASVKLDSERAIFAPGQGLGCYAALENVL